VGPTLSSIEQLAARLPFKVDDSEAVNALFARVRAHQAGKDVEHIELWTYCFVWRYFVRKHIQRGTRSTADFEAVITYAFERIRSGREQLGMSSRYAHWVSVVCRNSYVNYARRSSNTSFLDQRASEILQAELPTRVLDIAMVRSAIQCAIERLPGYLTETARLYWIDGYSYEEMAEITGRNAPTLRAYMHKAAAKLREDPQFKDFRNYMNDDFFDE
jgi:RNA polymerase sigma factor (sigma-70 family)